MTFNSLKNLLWLFANRKVLKNWKKRNFESPAPEFIKHKIIEKYNLEKSLWIETGTYYGDTTFLLSKISEKVISIEADERLSNLAKNRFLNFDNIEIINDQSQNCINEILEKNKDFNNLCIFLDAHLCNDHLQDVKTFGEEKNGTPILLELFYIEKFIKNFEKINILIDDIRLFDTNFQNYPSKNELINWSQKNRFSWDIQHDIFIMTFNKNL